MSAYRLRPRARQDLVEIWAYTADRWNADQADDYIRRIDQQCRAVAEGRAAGRSAEAVRPGYYRVKAGAHVVFYRLDEAGALEVVRVLHERMDHDQHL